MYQTTVGKLLYSSYKTYLAASPDGINIDEKSKYFGYMLEIKNIVNREITGNPIRILGTNAIANGNM